MIIFQKRTFILLAITAGSVGCMTSKETRQNDSNMVDHTGHSETVGAVDLKIQEPAMLQSNKSLELKFTLDGPHGVLKRQDLKETHEKLLHFVIVDEGLSDFNHLHPTIAENGTWTQAVTPKFGGKYLVFGEGETAKSESFAARAEIESDGEPSKDRTQFVVSLKSKSGAYSADIVNPTELAASDSMVRVRVSPPDGWEPYLGAPGHLILIDRGGREFVHAHPTKMVEGIADFHASFRKPGLYRGWAQFQREGKIVTFPFTIDVPERTTTPSESHSGHH